MFMLAGLLGIMAAGTAAIMTFDIGGDDDDSAEAFSDDAPKQKSFKTMAKASLTPCWPIPPPSKRTIQKRTRRRTARWTTQTRTAQTRTRRIRSSPEIRTTTP